MTSGAKQKENVVVCTFLFCIDSFIQKFLKAQQSLDPPSSAATKTLRMSDSIVTATKIQLKMQDDRQVLVSWVKELGLSGQSARQVQSAGLG